MLDPLYTILFISILMSIILYIKKRKQYKTIQLFKKAFNFFILNLVLLSMIIILIFSICQDNITKTNIRHTEQNKTYIYSIQYDGCSDEFVVGTDIIKNKMYYRVLVSDDYKGKLTQHYQAKDLHIITEDIEKPYYIEKEVRYDRVVKDSFIFGKIFKPIGIIKNDYDYTIKELHVPKNLIILN